MSDDTVDLIVTLDRKSGKLIKTHIKEPGAQPRQVELDVHELTKLLHGTHENAENLMANRTGPDPRRL